MHVATNRTGILLAIMRPGQLKNVQLNRSCCLQKHVQINRWLQISVVELSRALVNVVALSLQTHPHVQLHGFALMRVSRRNPHHVDPLLPSLRQRLQHQSRSIR